MGPDRYLDIAHRYQALANTGFNFFSVLSIALIGWLVTVSTQDRFDPGDWTPLRYWIAGFYVTSGAIACASLWVSSIRANAALRIARAKLSETEQAELKSDVERLTTPYLANLIIGGCLCAGSAIAIAVVVLLRPR